MCFTELNVSKIYASIKSWNESNNLIPVSCPIHFDQPNSSAVWEKCQVFIGGRIAITWWNSFQPVAYFLEFRKIPEYLCKIWWKKWKYCAILASVSGYTGESSPIQENSCPGDVCEPRNGRKTFLLGNCIMLTKV